MKQKIDLTDRKNCFYWQTDRNLSPEDYKRIFMHRHELSAEVIANVLKQGITAISDIKTVRVINPDENVVKGNVNIVRKVQINGTEYVSRIHPREVKNGYFYAEQQALEEAKLKGVPVPLVIEVHEARDELDMDFILMSSSPGITMDVLLQKDLTLEVKLLIDCGKQMAKIHQVKVSGFGAFDNQIAKQEHRLQGLHHTYNDFIHVGLEENLDRLIKYQIISTDEAAKMAGVFKTHAFEPQYGPRLVHNDFADWNLLTDGQNITAVLDWDECHAGDPIADLACWSTFFDMERMQKFIEGYKTLATLPTDFEKRFHYYRLRYTISKMALRIKRFQVDKSPFILDKLEVGKIALREETKWFGL